MSVAATSPSYEALVMTQGSVELNSPVAVSEGVRTQETERTAD